MYLYQNSEVDVLELFVWIVIGIVAGLMGAISIPLFHFIQCVEDENVCGQCMDASSCFARKKVFKDSNYLSEFMLMSFCRVHDSCQYTSTVSKKKVLGYIFCNMILVGIPFWSKGCGATGIVFGVSSAMLLALSIVDWNTQYIPVEYTGIIFLCGLIHLFADFSNWLQYLIGLFAVSGFLCVFNWIATPVIRKKYDGTAEIDSVIGDGDIKLMAATGLLLGWKLNFIALGIGCIAGSVIQMVLIKIKESDQRFAFGPYLSLGVYITMICGEQLVSWYLNMLGVIPY